MPPPNLMSFEDFQRLPNDKQSEEIFKLLSMLSPFASEVSSLRSSMESAHNRISELEASKSSIQPSKAQQGLYARNDEKLVLSGNIAKPNAPSLPVSTTPAYGMGGLSGAGMGLAAIGVGVAGFGAAAMPQLAPPSEADTFVMKDPDLGEGPNSPASNSNT